MKRGRIFRIALIATYFIFVLVSWLVDFTPGKEISRNFGSFAIEMLKIIPCVFILIGLFEVWVKTETVKNT